MSRLSRVRIRTLRPEERIPDSRPRRYFDGRGYVRLRWKLDDGSYVEEYEHRVVMGRPDSSFDVHHINGNKADNRPENLLVLTKREHGALHEDAYRRDHPARGRQDTLEKRARAVERQKIREARARNMAELYRAGMSTVAIAEISGCHPSNVSRTLRAAGVTPRNGGHTGPTKNVRSMVQARAGFRCERCGRSVKWEVGQIHHRRTRAMGGTRRPSSNQPSNLVLLCVACHDLVTADMNVGRRGGWRVAQVDNPADIPLRLFDGRIVRLLDDGCYGNPTCPDCGAEHDLAACDGATCDCCDSIRKEVAA